MQTLEKADYSNVAGAAGLADVETIVLGWLIGKGLDLAYNQMVQVSTYLYNNGLPVTDSSMYNAMGDFNIIPTAVDNDG